VKVAEIEADVCADDIETFEFLWQTYALADDSTLDPSAKALKRRLLEITGLAEIEARAGLEESKCKH